MWTTCLDLAARPVAVRSSTGSGPDCSNARYSGGTPSHAVTTRALPSYRNIVPKCASQIRLAFTRMDRKTDSKSPGELEMTRSTSEAAVCCFSASSRSRRSCADSLCARTVVALRRFGIALRLRALAGLVLALERRRIAHPKGLGLRRFSKWHYSRDLRLAEWGFGLAVHSGHRRLAISAMSALPPKADIDRSH